MKVILYILAFVFGTFILHAEPPQWQTVDDLESWLRTKEKLEIREYNDVGKSVGDWYDEGRLDANKCAEITKMAENLAFNKFEDLMDAKDRAGVSGIFEGVSPNSGVKLKIMDALADCKDVEFSARIVHHALGRPNWISDRGFSYPNAMSRWNLVMKVMGWETFDEVPTEYKGESPIDQKAMKKALEKKWPGLVEENAREAERNPPSHEAAQDAASRAGSPQRERIDSEATDSKCDILLIVGLALSALTLLIVLVRTYLRRAGRGIKTP